MLSNINNDMNILPQKIIAIVGPTATGKSDLAIVLAKKIGGEVISADSRQVYKGLDIGTGKITKKEMRGVPHYMIDVISPKYEFSVADFKKLAEEKIKEIAGRGNIPIICGGTGFYIDALLQNQNIPNVPPNKKLRKELDLHHTSILVSMLKKLDPRRFKNIDQKNRVRIIRAIEIASALGSVPKQKTIKSAYKIIWIGLDTELETLKKRIENRLQTRLRSGMLKEGEYLHKQGLSWKKMEVLGLEYRFMSLYLQGKMSREDFEKELTLKIFQYAKRQKTWFKRNKKIKWFDPTKEKTENIINETKNSLK